MLRQILKPETFAGRWALRVREFALDQMYTERGLPRVVNGTPLRVLPRQRRFFPPDYDAPVATFLRGRVGPGMTCINVGANVGIYAMQFAAWCAPTGKVVAFEPNPASAAVLRRHLEINQLTSRVRVVEQAVSAESGTASFFAAGTDGMSRLGEANPLLQQEIAPIQVTVTTLDRFCELEHVQPDWVLLDVEGFEIAALRGFSKAIASRPSLGIVVEMHPDCWASAGSSEEQFKEWLGEMRLTPLPLTGQRDVLKDYGLVFLSR